MPLLTIVAFSPVMYQWLISNSFWDICDMFIDSINFRLLSEGVNFNHSNPRGVAFMA